MGVVASFAMDCDFAFAVARTTSILTPTVSRQPSARLAQVIGNNRLRDWCIGGATSQRELDVEFVNCFVPTSGAAPNKPLLAARREPAGNAGDLAILRCRPGNFGARWQSLYAEGVRYRSPG